MNTLPARAFRLVAALNGFAVAFVLSIYAYGGLFSRYLADDYCESFLLLSSRNVFDATLTGYKTWFNSYSILFFVQIMDWMGIWGFRLMSAITLLAWTVCLTWLISEIGRLLRPGSNLAVHVWMAGLTIFLALYQAPNLYQILYWRTSLIPYTLPLVFFIGIAALIVRYARFPYQRSQAMWAGITCIGLVVFASGLGETTAALQVGALGLAVLLVWFTRHQHRREDVLTVLALSFVASVAALLIIAFSPGTTNRMDMIMSQPPLFNPIELSVQVIIVTSQFLWDALKISPLPHLISITIPFGILYVQSSYGRENFSHILSSRIRLAILVILFLMFLVIGFSFAPSTFVRSFPVARARFAAHFVITFSLILEGALLGILADRIHFSMKPAVVQGTMIVFLGLSALYPLRASSKIYASIAEYRYFAIAWDARDKLIRQSISEGAKDVVVVQLDSMGGVGEYKGNERHWINRCAANYYGLDTLRAP